MDLTVLCTWPSDDDISEALHLAHTEAIALLKVVSLSSSELCTPSCDLVSSSLINTSEEDEEISTSHSQPVITLPDADKASTLLLL